MRSRFWARLLLVLMLAVAMPLGPARAAQAATTPPVLEVMALGLPSAIKAGSTLTVELDVRDPGGKVGIGGGFITLNSAAKQGLSVRLLKVGESKLRGQLALSPNMAPGAWYVGNLVVWNQNGQEVRYSKENGLNKTITIEPSGLGADGIGPEVTEVVAPAEAVTGDLITLTAKVKDDVSGVSRVVAFVEPAIKLEDRALWSTSVELFPTGVAGEYAGNMLADSVQAFGLPQQIVQVMATDKAGNVTSLSGDALAKKEWKLKTEVKDMPKVAEGLKTSPFLNLIHPGEMAYWHWIGEDLNHMKALLAQGATDPTAVRKALAAEIPMVRAAIDGLRQELYTDPNTGIKVSPYATTGKWMVLDAGMTARTELLMELERKEGKLAANRGVLTADSLTSIYTVMGKNEYWATMENATRDLFAQIPAAMLKVLAQSPEAVQALKTPAWESGSLSPRDQFDRNVIYFMPVYTVGGSYPSWNSGEIFVPVTIGTQLTNQVKDLFTSVGSHFGDAYMASLDAGPDARAQWDSYLNLRYSPLGAGNYGVLSLPNVNIGMDFAAAYLPFGLDKQFETNHWVYSELRENPATMAAFKKIVADRLTRKPAPVTITPLNYIEVGLSDTVTFTVKGAGQSRGESQGLRWASTGAQRRTMDVTTSGDTKTYTMKDGQMGRETWYYLTAQGTDARTYVRYLYYYRAPVLLDPLPAATNQKTYKVTGTAPAGSSVAVNGKSATVGSQGRFTAELTLSPGVNKIEVAVSGITLTATYQVVYEPEGTSVPLSVTVPGSSKEKYITGTGTTAPYATVAIGGLRTQANAKGEFPLYVPLEEGANKVAITATSPAGNKTTWNGVVVRDTTPPVLTVAIPKLTNVPIFKLTGKTDPSTTVTVNGEVVVAGADGSFAIDVKLAAGQATKVEVVATDNAGNRVTQTGEITYTAGVPGVTRQDSVVLYGKVTPGTNLSYKGSDVRVNLDGSFELRVDVPAGRNVYTLTNTSGDKTVGVIQFVVVNPLKVAAPADLGDGKVKISGKTVPGYVVMVDGQLAAVDANGDWSVTLDRAGKSTMKVTANGDGQSYEYNLILP
ncbi:MAG TPA: hypothetical protein VK464_26310 [Symbiobacteriaceae bacterium]|nr:hypothetical protein [Symbiobacteriaceae bacterium]